MLAAVGIPQGIQRGRFGKPGLFVALFASLFVPLPVKVRL
jgi:hypothetical protein